MNRPIKSNEALIHAKKPRTLHAANPCVGHRTIWFSSGVMRITRDLLVPVDHVLIVTIEKIDFYAGNSPLEATS
jgi:hypothetical protein